MSSAVEATPNEVPKPVGPASPAEVVNTEALLAPIPGENPSGVYLKYEGVYDQIMDARRSEDTLEQGDWKRETKVADWDKVETLTSDALTTRSKDLQICAWLNEALIKNYGFVGLRDGLKVMRGLHERFWETVYPEIDRGDIEDLEEGAPLPEGDLTGRANALAWLDRQAASAIREVPITRARLGYDYSFVQFEDSKQFTIPDKVDETSSDEMARVTELRTRAAEEGRITSEDWLKAKATTPRAFYEELFAILNECWTEFEALDRAMDETFKRDTPGLGALKKSLDEIRTGVDKLVKEKRILEPDPSDLAGGENGEGAGVEGEAGGDGAGVGGAGGSTRSRQDALRKLAEVAEFFRRTEPHSPVSYLVQRAIRWGQMPLDEWLVDVVKNDGVLDHLRETLGLQQTSGGSSPDESS